MVLRASYAFVAAALLVHWSTLSQYMVDVPYADDWRLLTPGPHLLPAELDLSWIFRPSNSTVYATSKLLDYLFFTHTTGNFAFHQQLTSLAILAGCVVSSTRLLARLELPLPWHVLGVLSTVYFLQVQSYWGIASLAYQQALPVLGMLAALVLLTSPRWSLGRALALGVVVLASGLAYVSGALAMCVLGAFALAAARVLGRRGDLLTRAGIVLGCGLFTALLQAWLVEDPVPGGAVATPLDWHFWHFAFHLVARALGDTSTGPSSWLGGAVLAAIGLAAIGTAVVRAGRRVRVGEAQESDLRFVLVAGGLLACVGAYLAVVSFGRASFPRPVALPAELAAAAKARFHYWWVVALVPWLAVSPHFLLRGRRADGPVGGWRTHWAVPAAVAAALVSVQSPRMWDFDAYYALQAERRMEGLRCLLRGHRTPGPIHCETLVWRRPRNLRPQLLAAHVRSLHFSRLFEPPRSGAGPGAGVVSDE